MHVSAPRSTSSPSSLTTAGKHCELASRSAARTLPSTEPLKSHSSQQPDGLVWPSQMPHDASLVPHHAVAQSYVVQPE